MKKLFFLLFATIILVACEGPVGPVGPKGATGEGMNWNIEYITVNSNEWEKMPNTTNPNETYYKCVKKFKSITDQKTLTFIYDSGRTSAYIYHEYDTDNETQTSLPYVLNLNDRNDNPYTETWYYDYTIGDIAFYVAYSGDQSIVQRPGDTVFRVVMNW